MIKTKHDAMKEYFEPKAAEIAGSILGFNFSEDTPNSVAFVTNYSDKIRKKYIRGAEKEYGFTVLVTKPYSVYTDDLNLEAMNFAQSFMDWVEEQNRAKNFPDFPENCQVKKIENMQNMPNMAGINAEEGLAQYMIQCRLIYFEKGVL